MERRTAIIVLHQPADLDGLRAAEDLEYYFDGDPERVVRMLKDVVSTEGGRLAVALDADRIVGYCGALPPRVGARFFPVPSTIELSVFEVARSWRRQGLFTALFKAAFARDLEAYIVYAVADPYRRHVSEAPRAFRAIAETVLGAAGMVPLPIDDPDVHRHRDATLFARVGRGVPTADVEDFFKRLRSSARASVAITMREPALRNLLRADLERGGFHVVAVRSTGADPDVDVLVTDEGAQHGKELTVRLSSDLTEPRSANGTLWFPSTELDRLPEFLREEIVRRRSKDG